MILRWIDRNEKEFPSSTELRPETKSPETNIHIIDPTQSRKPTTKPILPYLNLKMTSILSHFYRFQRPIIERALRACLQMLHSEVESTRQRWETRILCTSSSILSILLNAPNLHNPTLPASDRPRRFPSLQSSQ